MKFLSNCKSAAKKVCVSLLLSSAVLAIANVDTLWQERLHQADTFQVAQPSKQAVGLKLKSRLPAASQEVIKEQGAELSSADKLSAAMTQDEIAAENPFANLSTLDPLNSIYSKGILNFQRQAFRSSEYREEFGYDLLEYDIEHKDHSHSIVLAYVEKPLVDKLTNDSQNPQVSGRVPVVIMMESANGLAKQAVFRSNLLINQSELPLIEAQALVNDKLSSGIPFFSVAR